jgi:hypothetical protein
MMDKPAPVVDEIAVRCQWVIDKVWVTVRLRTSDGQFMELQPQAMEWPLEPRSLSDWLDVTAEATNLPVASLAVPGR